MATRLERLAAAEHDVRPWLVKTAPMVASFVQSHGRKPFLRWFDRGAVPEPYVPPEDERRTLWGLEFRSGIMNAAGMFKKGQAMQTVFDQGAGAYLGGTTTHNKRGGFTYRRIRHPMIALPNTGSSVNKMGLPGPGITETVEYIRKHHPDGFPGFPVGWSVAPDDSVPEKQRLNALVDDMIALADVGVDWLEVNLSCPNTEEGPIEGSGFDEAVRYIDERFNREYDIPVVVKISNDTHLRAVPRIVETLVRHRMGGINLGNTSTDYQRFTNNVRFPEQRAFRVFTQRIGGGVGGALLRRMSRDLTEQASMSLRSLVEGREAVELLGPYQEFNIFRTGGVQNLNEIRSGERAGASMQQWFTGYWDRFGSRDTHDEPIGHRVYRDLFATQAPS